MPEISRFYGIVVRMWYDDHPPPHIHVEYAGYKARVFLDGDVQGHMPRQALRLVWAWIDEYQDELLENWERARKQVALRKIPPLR
jgi:hypothetical protein